MLADTDSEYFSTQSLDDSKADPEYVPREFYADVVKREPCDGAEMKSTNLVCHSKRTFQNTRIINFLSFCTIKASSLYV